MLKSAKMIEQEKAEFRDSLKREIKSYIDYCRIKEYTNIEILSYCTIKFSDKFKELFLTQTMFYYNSVMGYMMYWIELDEKWIKIEN